MQNIFEQMFSKNIFKLVFFSIVQKKKYFGQMKFDQNMSGE